ncbi:hypothetical protein, partial [Enterobacter asburiae]|uniref:hypothetical protein n=1 Tax=Enterobacter asburiae TaxID=61645 RepID=UPI003523D7C5
MPRMGWGVRVGILEIFCYKFIEVSVDAAVRPSAQRVAQLFSSILSASISIARAQARRARNRIRHERTAAFPRGQ